MPLNRQFVDVAFASVRPNSATFARNIYHAETASSSAIHNARETMATHSIDL